MWSPLVLLGRHGDLKWRPLMDASVAMATKWRPFPRWNSYVGIPMWSPFARVGRHGDLKWRPFDALQFPLSPWRLCSDLLLPKWRKCPVSSHLWAFLHISPQLHPNGSWNLIKPETLIITPLNTGKCPRNKQNESEMRAKIIPILAWSNTPKPIFC